MENLCWLPTNKLDFENKIFFLKKEIPLFNNEDNYQKRL